MINNLFNCPVYEENLNLDVKNITKYCLNLKNNSKNLKNSNITGLQFAITNDEINITDEIYKHLNIFNKTLNIKKLFTIKNMWANINNFKDYNIEHSHPGCLISGVYYSQVEKNSGDLIFLHPAKDVLVYDWENYNSITWKFTPNENKLFLFPSWLKHYVMPNLNTKERISISFNIV